MTRTARAAQRIDLAALVNPLWNLFASQVKRRREAFLSLNLTTMPSSAFRPSASVVSACRGLTVEVERLRHRCRRAGTIVDDVEQETIETPSGQITFDHQLSVIMHHLVERGVKIRNSCHDVGGSVWLCMNLDDFKLFHGIAREIDDLALFVDSCQISLSCYTPEHASQVLLDMGDDTGEHHDAVYLANIFFPTKLRGLFEELLQRLCPVVVPEEEEPPRRRRRTRRRASSDVNPPEQ